MDQRYQATKILIQTLSSITVPFPSLVAVRLSLLMPPLFITWLPLITADANIDSLSVNTKGGRIQGHCSRLPIFLIPSLSSTSEAGGQLSSPQRALVAGSFACLPLPCASLPVSPLPCLRSDTVWLEVWLVTALQGPCQRFVLRESAGLALFRSLTVPLLGSVPSRCRCFNLLTPLACFLWLFAVSCGTGWASTSVDNVSPLFHFR